MKKYKYILTAILSFFILLPNVIYAECTNEDIEEFKEVENEHKLTYEFNQDTKDYTITTYAPLPEKYDYLLYIGEDKIPHEITPNEFKFYNVPPGEYKITIIGQTEECRMVFKTETLKLSEYNNYSSDPLCEGIEEFVLCQPTYERVISYEEFVERVNVYKKTKKEKQEQTKEKDKVAIVNFIKDNLIKIIAIVVFIVALVITTVLAAKSIRKSRRLE